MKKVNKEKAIKLARQCADAYSANRYENWTNVAWRLLDRGYTEREAEAIMRSKWTRWAADMSDAKYAYGKIPASAIIRFLEYSEAKWPHEYNEAAVQELVRQTF